MNVCACIRVKVCVCEFVYGLVVCNFHSNKVVCIVQIEKVVDDIESKGEPDVSIGEQAIASINDNLTRWVTYTICLSFHLFICLFVLCLSLINACLFICFCVCSCARVIG